MGGAGGATGGGSGDPWRAGNSFGGANRGLVEQSRLVRPLYERSPRQRSRKRRVGQPVDVRKRPQEAYTYFTHAVELDPDDARTNYSFGETYLSFGQVNFAEKYLRKANDLKPNEPCFCYALGLVLGVEGRLPEAEAAYHCAEGMKAPGRVYVGLGLVLEKEGRLQEARAEFQKALDIEPETGAAAQIQRIDQKLKANQSK